MRVAGAPSLLAAAGLAAVVTVAGASCDMTSLDEDRLRSARQQRSAVSLARYLQDDLVDDYKDDARALQQKMFEHALARIGDRRNAELARALLTHLRDARDPRIAVYIAPPTLSPDLSPGAAAYFDRGSVWDHYFADGASRASAAAFPHEVMMFAVPDSLFDYDPARAGARVDVTWSVRPSGALFRGPASIASIGRETPPVQGIAVEATLRFTLRGAGGDPIEVSASGDPGSQVTYTSMYGFADEDDLYAGMVEGSFERVVAEIFALLEPAAP